MYELRIRMSFALLITLIFANVSLVAQIEKENSSVFDMKEFEEFSLYYYLHPKPHKAAITLKKFMNSPLFAGEESDSSHHLDTTAYFFSRIAQTEQSIINDYLNIFKESSHEQRCFVLKILQVCGNESVVQFFESNLKEGNFSNEKRRIEYALKKGIPIGFDPLTRRIDEGGDLDFLWWDFMATGKKEPVLKIVETLKDYNSRIIESFIVARVAEWSLDSFCRQHDRVMQICRQQISQSSGIVRERLEKIVTEIDIEKLPEKLSAEKMIKAVIRDVTLGIEKESIRAKSKTFYRLGSTCWRIEKPSFLKSYLITIVKEPDIWIIQMPKNTGLHFIGPYPVNYFFPIIKNTDGQIRLRGLQLGTEVLFMQAKKAQKKSITYEGKDCILFSVNTEKVKVELICKKHKQIPLKLTVSEEENVICCYMYEEYYSDLEPDSSLFKVPKDAKISEDTASIKNNKIRIEEGRSGLSPFIKDRLPEQLK